MKDCKVDPNKTFANMVRMPFNSFAIAGAKGIIGGKVQGYSPLYIYGQSGTGKTHLLQAMANEELRKGNTGVRFVTCEMIRKDFLESLQSGQVVAFRQRYRNCRILLIDDVELSEHSKNFQEELFNLLKALEADGVPVACSSSAPPKMLRDVEPKLVSAFEEGMILEIEMPERSDRKALITAMILERKISMDVTEADFFARESRGMTPSDLIAVSNKVQTAMRENGGFSADEIRRIVESECNAFVGAQADTKLIEFADIIEAVQNVCGVPDFMLKSHSRDNPYRDARNVAMYVARKFTTLSLPELSKRFDCCHPTFIRAVKLSEKRIPEDEKYKKLVVMVLDKLGYHWEGTR